MLAATPGTADTPRAHITNMAALECLRDIGLEEECKKVAVKGDSMQHTRWCRSMAGEEFARIYSWGNDPQRAVRGTIMRRQAHADLPRATTMLPVLAHMSIFLKLSSSLFSSSMRSEMGSRADLILPSSPSNANLMALFSVMFKIFSRNPSIRYGQNTCLDVMGRGVRFYGN
jgi:hypothetical protein